MPELIEIKIPSLGESVSEATIAKWNKADGEYVGPDGRVTKEDVLAYIAAQGEGGESDSAAAAHSLQTQAPDGVMSTLGTTNVPARPPAPPASTAVPAPSTPPLPAPSRPLAQGEE